MTSNDQFNRDYEGSRSGASKSAHDALGSGKGTAQQALDSAKGTAQQTLDSAKGTAQQALGSAKDTAYQALDSAKGTAQQALDGAKGLAAQAHLDEVGSKAAAAASDLYQQGRDLANSDEVTQVTEQLGSAIRKNPLAAVGIAFSAGLLFALLARG